LLQFCTAYMVYDGICIVLSRFDPSVSLLPVFQPGDFLFLAHHLLTTIYMTQTRVYQAGHMSAMMCMLLGELTNPLHNSYIVSEKAILLGISDNHQLHTMVETAFAFLYILFRVVIAPVVCSHMSWDLLFSKQGRENLPLAVRLFWSFMIWAVIIGSYSWIVFCYGMLEKNLLLMNGETQEL
jgi:hypothetical protein